MNEMVVVRGITKAGWGKMLAELSLRYHQLTSSKVRDRLSCSLRWIGKIVQVCIHINFASKTINGHAGSESPRLHPVSGPRTAMGGFLRQNVLWPDRFIEPKVPHRTRPQT